MPFRGFTEAKHNDGALNDLETRLKNTFNQVKSSRILGGSLLSGVSLKSTPSESPYPTYGINRFLLTILDNTAIKANTTLKVRTSNTFREGDETTDWASGGSATDTASNIASYFDDAEANLAVNSSGATVEFLPRSISSVLQSVSLEDFDGFGGGTIQPVVKMSTPDAALFGLNEYIRFGPSSISAPSDILPGVSRVVSKSADFGATGMNVFIDSFPSQIRNNLYVYKLTRNPILGVSSGSKYMVLNQDRPSKIWSEAGSGTLTLLCDNDCTVDLWVF